MEPKVYTYQKKYTLSNGEVRYCESKNTYTPKNAPGKQVRKKREGSIYEITQSAKELNNANRELLKAYIRDLQERQRTEASSEGSNQNITEVLNHQVGQTV